MEGGENIPLIGNKQGKLLAFVSIRIILYQLEIQQTGIAKMFQTQSLTTLKSYIPLALFFIYSILLNTMFQDLTTLVLDIGTYQSRIGYGGDEAPKVVAPSYVCSAAVMEESERRNFAGKKYLSLDKTDLQIQSIFRQRGEGQSVKIDQQNYFNFMEFLLNDQLRVNLKDYSLLFSEDVNFTHNELLHQRDIIAKIAFEKLGVSNIFFLKTPVLSCFATGRSTSLVVDSGDSHTRVTAVHDGFVLNKTSKIVPYGGKTLSQEFQRVIRSKTNKNLQTRYQLSNSSHTQSFLQFHKTQLLTDIKRSFSIGGSEQGSEVSEKIQYELPDRSIIAIDRSETQDIFINPNESWCKQFNKYEYHGVPNMITDTVNACDVDIKKELYSNILLTGGNILFNGQNFVNSILSKVNNSAPPNAKVKPVSVCQHSERQFLPWIGGSIVTSLSAFQSYWIGKQEYESLGTSILQRKCT